MSCGGRRKRHGEEYALKGGRSINVEEMQWQCKSDGLNEKLGNVIVLHASCVWVRAYVCVCFLSEDSNKPYSEEM